MPFLRRILLYLDVIRRLGFRNVAYVVPGRDKLSQKWSLKSEPHRGGVTERKE